MLAGCEEDLYNIDKDIETEINFAKENPIGSTYSSAGSDARKRVKYMKKIRREQVKLIYIFENFIKQEKKIYNMQRS